MRVELDSGEVIELGTTEDSPTIGITDFTRRTTDDFGVTTVVERGFARTMSIRMSVTFDDVDALQRRLATLRSTPALWVADDRFASLKVRGFFKEFSIDLAVPPLSYCTLTIEGLTQTAAYADPGGDPAPTGQTSTLQLLQPVTLTTAMLVTSTVAENDYAQWAAGTVYPLGAHVILAATHRKYESATAGNVGNDPAGASGKWIDIGPTNRWAMFDQALGTATTAAGSIVVTVNVGATNAVALLDVVANTVRLQKDNYDRTVSVTNGIAIFPDLPNANTQLAVTVAGSGTVSVGTLLAGKMVMLGVTEASPSAGIIDYSRKDVDDFGTVTIAKRGWAKRMTARALIRSDALDVVVGRITSVRALPSLWIGQAGIDSLTVYGFFKEFSVEVGDALSKLSLSIEGFAAASKALPLTVDWPNVRDPWGTRPDDWATFGAIVGDTSGVVSTLQKPTGGYYTKGELETALGIASGIAYQGAFATINSAAYGSPLLTGFNALAAQAFVSLNSLFIRRADGTTALTENAAVTALGIAQGFSNQGLFATLNSAAYGSSLLTGFGTLSPLNSISLGTSFIRRADGSTTLTEPMVVTNLGTSASIQNQGTGATANTLQQLDAAAKTALDQSQRSWVAAYGAPLPIFNTSQAYLPSAGGGVISSAGFPNGIIVQFRFGWNSVDPVTAYGGIATYAGNGGEAGLYSFWSRQYDIRLRLDTLGSPQPLATIPAVKPSTLYTITYDGRTGVLNMYAGPTLVWTQTLATGLTFYAKGLLSTANAPINDMYAGPYDSEVIKLLGMEAGATRNNGEGSLNRNSIFDMVDNGGALTGWTIETGAHARVTRTDTLKGGYASQSSGTFYVHSDAFPIKPGQPLWFDLRFNPELGSDGTNATTTRTLIAVQYSDTPDFIAVAGYTHTKAADAAYASGWQGGTEKFVVPQTYVSGTTRVPLYARIWVRVLPSTANNRFLIDYAAVRDTEEGSTLGADVNSNIRDSGNANTLLTRGQLVTTLGTASGISNQSPWATYLGLSPTTVAGQVSYLGPTGQFASFSNITDRRITQTTRADGTTAVTEALVVTSLGTAGSITSQSPWATYSGLVPSTVAGQITNLGPSGNFASFANITDRRITQTTRADGSTSVTEAMVVTNQGTAAAFTGQGYGATAAQSAVDNTYVPTGVNVVVNSSFARPAANFFGATSAGGGSPYLTVSQNIPGFFGRRNVAYIHPGDPWGGTSGAYVDISQPGFWGIGTAADVPKYYLPVKQNDRVGVRALIAPHRCNVELYLLVFDKNGTLLQADTTGQTPNPNGGGADGDYFGPPKQQISTIASASAAWATIMIRATANGGSDPYVLWSEPWLGKLAAGQTVLPEYSYGPPDPLGDRTGVNTAAAISNQADWATYTGLSTGTVAGKVSRLQTDGAANGDMIYDKNGLGLLTDVFPAQRGANVTGTNTAAGIANQADWATYTGISTGGMAGRVTNLSGTGQFASFANITERKITQTTRADGSTTIEESMVVTNLGTAAAIQYQGALATQNAVGTAQISANAVTIPGFMSIDMGGSLASYSVNQWMDFDTSTGGGMTGGGSSGGAGGGTCPQENEMVLLANNALDGPGVEVRAGEVRAGVDWVWSAHEHTRAPHAWRTPHPPRRGTALKGRRSMPQLQFPDKYPDEVTLLQLDWVDALSPGDEVATATATATEATVQLVGTIGTVTTIRVSGGAPVQFGGVIRFTATTVKGETLGENVRLRIKPR